MTNRVNMTTLAKFLGMHHTSVREWHMKGLLERGSDNMFDLQESLRAYYERKFSPETARLNYDSDVPPINHSKAMHYRVKGEILEHKIKIKRYESTETAAIERLVARINANCEQMVSQSIKELTKKLAYMDDMFDVKQLLKKKANDTLQKLSEHATTMECQKGKWVDPELSPEEAKISRIVQSVSELLAPPPMIGISQWADRYRVLSTQNSNEAGRWRTDRVPHMRDVMDAASPYSKTQTITIMSSAQIAKTETLTNIAM